MNADAAARLEEARRLELEDRWGEAVACYDGLPADGMTPAERASATLRRANALLRLRDLARARVAFDEALVAAKAAGDPLRLAEALAGAGVFAASQGELGRGERFLLGALEGYHAAHGPEGIRGEGWALLNLATVYGKTRRLDLAFLSFDKARERLFLVGHWAGVATAWEMQAELRSRLGDADRWREDVLEAIAFFEKGGMVRRAEALRARLEVPRPRTHEPQD